MYKPQILEPVNNVMHKKNIYGQCCSYKQGTNVLNVNEFDYRQYYANLLGLSELLFQLQTKDGRSSM